MTWPYPASIRKYAQRLSRRLVVSRNGAYSEALAGFPILFCRYTRCVLGVGSRTRSAPTCSHLLPLVFMQSMAAVQRRTEMPAAYRGCLLASLSVRVGTPTG